MKNDLTGNLSQLKKAGAMPKGKAPVFYNKPIKSDEREMALDVPGLLAWSLVGSFGALQLLLIIWFWIGI